MRYSFLAATRHYALFTFNYHKKDEHMKNQKEKKLFAFKLAEKKAQATKPDAQWKAREGVATAGCSFPSERYSTRVGTDNGVYC